MNDYKNLIYALTCLSFSVIIGAAFYEHLAVWPIAYDAPPKSLSMFQGEYGLNAVLFWSKIHPITLLLTLITLFLTWKSERRNHALIMLVGYILIMIATMTYFVPELISIGSTKFSDSVDQGLVQRGSTWITLSWIRLMLLIGLALYFFLGLTKSGNTK